LVIADRRFRVSLRGKDLGNHIGFSENRARPSASTAGLTGRHWPGHRTEKKDRCLGAASGK
jgi:hypothetical protein